MSEKRGTKALEVWCKRVTEGYPGVKVENMTTSWRDGLAFCALIHHFRPDLIDFDSLDKRDVFRNNELAFRIAERHLGIPALLDAEDMVEYEVPDRLSMLTYLSQFYQTFVGQQGYSPNSRTPVKRSSVSPSLSSSPDLSPSMSPTSISPPSKVPARGVSVGASTRSVHDSCAHCGLPVFLAERLLVGARRALYHRTCFRCARCSAQLTLANCYETEDGGFCCETCPDEEVDKCDSSSLGMDGLDLSDSKSESMCSAEASQNVTQRSLSLSDDEKSVDPQHERRSSADEYSAVFESTVESFQRKPAPHQSTVKAPLAITQMTSDLGSKSDDSSQKILHNTSVNSNYVKSETAQPLDKYDEPSQCQSTKEGTVPFKKALIESEGSFKRSGLQSKEGDQDVHSLSLESSDSNLNQPASVSTDPHAVSSGTKERKNCSTDNSRSSIVQMRRMMFEGDNTRKSVESSSSPRKSGIASGKEEEKSRYQEALCKTSDTSDLKDSQEGILTEFKKISTDNEAVSIGDDKNENASLATKSPEDNANFYDTNTISSESRISIEQNCKEEDNFTIGLETQVLSHEEVVQIEIGDSSNSSSVVPIKPSVSPRKTFPPSKHDNVLPSKSDVKENYPNELNPFGDEGDLEEETLHDGDNDKTIKEKIDSRIKTETKKESTNPFGSSDEEDSVVLRKKLLPEKPPRPPLPQSKLKGTLDHAQSESRHATIAVPSTVSPVPAQRRVIPAPANLNPFWSDGEEPEDENFATPVPLPRTLRTTPEPSPRPRTTIVKPSKPTSSSGVFGSSSSLSSMTSNTGTNRRNKKPAPAPPSQSAESSLHSNMSLPPSPNPSMRSPNKRKSRPAPQPPKSMSSQTAVGEVADKTALDGRKMLKDEANRTMQAVGKEELAMPRDKSTFGQWKRKKGPAPPRPLPQRRQVRAMPLKELKQELDDIEVKQVELERQGVKLEQTIRHKFDTAPSLNDSSMTPDVENLVIQLFELVNEKNELFRKQAELMYLRRQQRLEEEHAELEYQIRCLMEQPERNKTDTIKAREEELIQRLVEVVERRNEIIECLEMDRIREAEEDQSIHSRLGLFAAKNSKETAEFTPTKIKKEKKKKKEKDSKKKKDVKVDADKDIDEVEAAAVVATKEKKSKKKWFS